MNKSSKLSLSSRPDINDALDELCGTRQAFEGMITLLSCSNSSKIDIEVMTQFLKTFSLRLHMCEKVLQKATDETLADAA
ncbi:hypothetical protein LVJ85_08320 [Neisseria sp. Dent CA1/247]|uniref:hypothetical protein n=1 Tax=Neisseria sp. Dent CA1/247 TaxID=2912675 RepID=UPI001FD00021|nr:hypothetical protein [Neisseria sp. Dent CA1/247]UOO76052.1 hypothetical protein LVJ85_08320 [Neisseria sp. Dent CA1/247]